VEQTALFYLGSRLNHSCESNSHYTGNRIPGKGCHVALTPIEEGALITTNYLGDDAMMSTPMRRWVLSSQKLFHCECTRCMRPDETRVVPCPGCHPRVSNGGSWTLPPDLDIEGARYISPSRAADEWYCEGCARTWNADAVFPGVGELSGMDMENRVERVVYNLNKELDANVETSYSQICELLQLAAGVLGMRHWATVKMLDIQTQFLIGTPGDNRLQLEENSQTMWAFCGTAHVPPSYLLTSFLCTPTVLASDGGDVKSEILTRALVCRAMLVSEDFQATDTSVLQRRFYVPLHVSIAAAHLTKAAEEAMSSGKTGEAVHLYHGALLLEPQNAQILSKWAAALREQGRLSEADSIAIHCEQISQLRVSCE